MCQIAEISSHGGASVTLLNKSQDFCAQTASRAPANLAFSQSKRVVWNSMAFAGSVVLMWTWWKWAVFWARQMDRNSVNNAENFMLSTFAGTRWCRHECRHG